MKNKAHNNTPRCLLEKTRYQLIEVDNANRFERRAAKAIKRKNKKAFLTPNILLSLAKMNTV